MNYQHCRIDGCGVEFCRSSDVPIPHDICTRCHGEMSSQQRSETAVNAGSEKQSKPDEALTCEACGSVEGQYHAPECPDVNAFEVGRIKRTEGGKIERLLHQLADAKRQLDSTPEHGVTSRAIVRTHYAETVNRLAHELIMWGYGSEGREEDRHLEEVGSP